MSTEFIDVANTVNIQRELWIQCEREEFCDIALIAGTEEKRIPAHSCVLSAASKYFKGIFQTLKYENQVKEVKLHSVDGNILQSLVKYCYTGRLIISKNIAIELLKTADELLLHSVVTACANFLAVQLHPNNCFEFEHLAQQYHCKTLLQKARSYSLDHFMAVRETDEFLKLNAEQLSELLASENLIVSSEENVFDSLLAWIRHYPIEREKYQAELLKLVRLPLLKKSFLMEHVRPICASMESILVYTDALEQKLPPHNAKFNEINSVRPRKSNQLLLGLTLDRLKINIHYHCPQRLKWMKWSKDLEYRSYPGLAVMDGNIFLVGGGDQTNRNPLNTVACLNLETMNLTKVNPMTEHRKWCGAAILNGFLYAVGGKSKDGSFLNSVEKWNQNTNTWSKVTSMEASRSAFGIAVLNGKLYAVGGYSSIGGALNSVECYDPHKNVWMSIASMHVARFQFGVAAYNGLLYAVGGKGGIKIAERYNPETNCWSMLSTLNDNLVGLECCTTFRDKVIVCYEDRTEEYNEETSEWKTNTTLKILKKNHRIFTYSGELLTSEFREN